MVNLANLSEEERYFKARVSDAFEAADTKSCIKMVGFLDERQQEIVKALAKQSQCENYLLFGGYEAAQRKVLGVFPAYIDINEKEPAALFNCICAVTLRFRAEDCLSHRDFLGALMNLNMKRESIGDILVGEGYAVLFVISSVKQIILDELLKVGRVGVRSEETLPDVLPVEEHFLEIKDTVSSLRLDCIVASLTRLSREKASALIAQGLVAQNYECIENNSHTVCQGDKITIRGYGKFNVAQVGGVSKKGRTQMLFQKYL